LKQNNSPIKEKKKYFYLWNWIGIIKVLQII
jgi:hypothetical protein